MLDRRMDVIVLDLALALILSMVTGGINVASEPKESDCRTMKEYNEQYCTLVCHGKPKLSVSGSPLCIQDDSVPNNQVLTTCICQDEVGGRGVVNESGVNVTARFICYPETISSNQGNCHRCIGAEDNRYQCHDEESMDRGMGQTFSTVKNYCACIPSVSEGIMRGQGDVPSKDTDNFGIGVVREGGPVEEVEEEKPNGNKTPVILNQLLKALQQVRRQFSYSN